MQAVMTWDNGPSTQDSSCSASVEDDLMELFDQFAGSMSPMSDWLEPDTVVISKASLQEKSATYQVIVQNIITSTLLDTGPNISVISERFCMSLSQTPHLLKVHMHKVTSASGANLGPIGQHDLTFRLGNKQFTNRFTILQGFMLKYHF